VSDFPDVPGYALELGQRYNELGIFLASAQRFPEAEQALRDGLRVQEKLLAKSPDRSDYRVELGRGEGNLGTLFAQAGKVGLAAQQYRKGISLLEEQEPRLTAAPALPGYLGELIKIHVNLANLMTTHGKPAEAEKSWLRVLQLREKLVKEYPLVPGFRLETVGALHELGQRVLQAQQFGAAQVYYAKAVEHLRELTRGPGAAPEMWANLYLVQLQLATSLVALKDHAGAYQVVREMAPEARPKDRHDDSAAALLARCITLADNDSQLPEAKSKELAKTYADLALALLHRAVANGFQDLDFLRQSEDLQPLRAHEDFQQLVRELAAPKK
jgi:tetratricopeptide (TPR) repeat protein